MKKLIIIFGVCGLLIAAALSALAEQGEPADPAGGAEATKAPAAKAPAAKAVKATTTKAPAAKARKAPPAPQKAVTTAAPAADAEENEADAEENEAEENEADAEENEADADEAENEDISALPEDMAGFVAAMREQIEQVDGDPNCDAQTGRCWYHYSGEGDETHEIHLWYSDVSQTIYIFVNHFVTAPQDAADPALVHYLSALNRVMEIARFEWNPTDGEVRLSTVINVDTNLDRHALRNVLRLVQDAATRYHSQVAELVEDAEDADDLPAPRNRSNQTVSDRFGYMGAIEEELSSLGYSPTCDAERGRCTFEIDSEVARNVFPIVVQYNSPADTVLITTDRFIQAPADNENTTQLLQRLLELNWAQLAPMFQWNSNDGTVRLAAMINTDSNFDRRAFRSVVQALRQQTETNYRELRAIAAP